MTVAEAGRRPVGELLREWRERRLEELAIESFCPADAATAVALRAAGPHGW